MSSELEAGAASINPPDLPAECGHKDWVLGCERCFAEACLAARHNIQTADQEMIMEGAALFAWHVVMVLENCVRQLDPLLNSLDLKQQNLGKVLMMNFDQLKHSFAGVMMDRAKLMAVLRSASLTMKAVESELKQAKDEPTSPTPSLIKLTDVA